MCLEIREIWFKKRVIYSEQRRDKETIQPKAISIQISIQTLKTEGKMPKRYAER